MTLLYLRLPDDEQAAEAVKSWAAEKGIRLKVTGTYRRPAAVGDRSYPYECKRGHVVASEGDEVFLVSNGRKYRWCAVCRRRPWRKDVA